MGVWGEGSLWLPILLVDVAGRGLVIIRVADGEVGKAEVTCANKPLLGQPRPLHLPTSNFLATERQCRATVAPCQEALEHVENTVIRLERIFPRRWASSTVAD